MNIQFSESGLDKLLERQERMRDAAKAMYETSAKALEELKAGGEAVSREDLKAKEAEVKRLKADFETLDKTVKQNNLDFNTVRTAIENLENLGPRAVNKLLSSVNRFGKNAGALTEEMGEKIRALLGPVREVADALSKGFQRGVATLTAPISEDATLSELKAIVQQYEQHGRVLAEASQDYGLSLRTMGERATDAKIRLGEMEGSMQSLSDGADVERVKRYMRGWQEVAGYIGASGEQAAAAEKKVAEARQRLVSAYSDVTSRPELYSGDELSAAVQWLQSYRKSVTLTRESRERLDEAIARGQAKMQEDVRMQQTAKMALQLGGAYEHLSLLSSSALEEQRKFWSGAAEAASAGGAEYVRAADALRRVNEEIGSRAEAKRADVMRNLGAASTDEIREAVKSTEQLRNAQIAGGEEWKAYGEEIRVAEEHLRRFQSEAKAVRLSEAGKSIEESTENIGALRHLTDQWRQLEQAEVDAGNGAGRYAVEIGRLEDVVRGLESAKARDVLSNPLAFSEEEFRRAVKVSEEEMRRMEASGDESWKAVASAVDGAKRRVDEFSRGVRAAAMEERLSDLSSLSSSALEEQRKFWSGAAEAASAGGAEYVRAAEALRRVSEEMNLRLSAEVERRGLTEYQRGSGGSISDLKESVKLLQRYRETIDTLDTDRLDKVDSAIKQMKDDIARTTEAVVEARHYMDADSSGDKSIAELEQIRKGLLELRRQTVLLPKDASKIGEIDRHLREVDSRIRTASMSQERFNEIVNNPRSVHSLSELKVVYDELRERIKRAEISQAEFNREAESIKLVKEQIDEMSASLESQPDIFDKVGNKVKELTVYFFSMNGVVNQVSEAVRGGLELSDSMTDVQKVTGMADEEIESLVDNLQRLDTRTKTDSLMAIAEQAGKLGIYSRYGLEGMQGFVEMGERIYATLGEDIGGEEAIADLAKLNDILHVTEEMGGDVGRALDATGSSILNLGNNSTASYGAIVQYVGRIGAVGSTANMTMPELVALGGTLDALKMPAESGATALSQILSSINNYTDKLAEAAGLSPKLLREMVAGGDTMGVLELLIDAMNRGAVSAQGLMDAMGGRAKSNVNIRNVWQLLAGNAEMLNENLRIAEEGFQSVGRSAEVIEEGSRSYMAGLMEQSVMAAEFARVNENAAGQVERLGNRWREIWVNSTAVSVITAVVTKLTVFVEWLTSGTKGAAVLKGALEGLAVGLLLVKYNFLGLLATAKKWGVAVLSMTKDIGVYTMALIKGEAATVQLSAATQRLKATMSRGNWIVMLISLLVTLGMELYNAAKKVGALTKALGEVNGELQRNVAACEAEFRALKDVERSAGDANRRNEERARIIGRINSMYGQYLGFMLKEADTADLVAAAHDRIIYKLNEEARLKMQERLVESVNEEFAESMKEKNQDLAKGAESLLGKNRGDEFMRELTERLGKYIGTPNLSADDIVKKLEIELGKKYEYAKSSTSVRGATPSMYANSGEIVKGSPVKELDSEIKNLLKVYEDYGKSMDRQVRMVNSMQSAAVGRDEDFRTANKLAGEKLKAARRIAEGGDIEANTEEYVESLDAYVKTVRPFLKAGHEELREDLDAAYAELAKWRPVVENRRANSVRERFWGKAGANYESWADKDLAAAIEKYNTASNKIQGGGDWGEIFPDIDIPQGWDEEKLRDFLYEEATKMRAVLDKRHENIGGKYKWESGKKPEEKAKDEYEAALASLDAYYKNRETLIQVALNTEEITAEEANRRQEALEQQHLLNRSLLRRDVVGGLTEGERTDFEEWWSGIEELDAVSWETLRAQSDKWSKAYRQKQVLAVEKDLSEVEKVISEHRKRIEDVLKEGDNVKAITDEFRRSMDTLDMIFGLSEREEERTALLGRRRMQQLAEWGREAYSLTADDLRKAMADASNVYHNWFVQLGADEEATLSAMLVRLRSYADDMTEAVRKSAKESERILSTKWKAESVDGGVTREKSESGKVAAAERRVAAAKFLDGVADNGMAVNDAELNLISVQIAEKQEYVNVLRREQEVKAETARQEAERMERELELAKAHDAALADGYGGEYSEDELDAMRSDSAQDIADRELELADKRQEMANLEMETNAMVAGSLNELDEMREEYSEKMLERTKKVFDNLKQYRGNIESFAESFGEGIFGSKEDRQDAARELLADLARTTKSVIQQYLTELMMKRQTDKMVVNQERVRNQQISQLRAENLADFGSKKIAELTVGASTSSAEVQEAIAKGTAEEVAKQGLIGLAKAAAIGVALNLLLGLALGAINKSKSEVASSTGASGSGKLVTGMLTYAGGKYPDRDSMVSGGRYLVDADDGRRYDARYEGSLKTGVYHGPHVAVFSERGDEMVIDHDTLSRMPQWMVEDIVMLHRTGRMRTDYGAVRDAASTLSLHRSRSVANMGSERGVRTYASGNVDEFGGEDAAGGTGITDDGARMAAALDRSSEVIARLSGILEDGIGVSYDKIRKDERWRSRYGVR